MPHQAATGAAPGSIQSASDKTKLTERVHPQGSQFDDDHFNDPTPMH
jgi:hypothetical protein